MQLQNITEKIELDNSEIPNEIVELFQEIGIPKRETIGIKFFHKEGISYLKDDLNERFLVFAKDDYDNFFGIRAKDLKVYLLSIEKSRCKRGALVNSNYKKFYNFVDLCFSNDIIRDLYDSEKEPTNEETDSIPKIAKELKINFKESDKEAVKDDESWWSTFVEELSYYGEEEEDFGY